MVISNSKYDERKNAGTKNRGYFTDASEYLEEIEKALGNPLYESLKFRLTELEE
jgi:hypothetical protein